MSEQEAVAYIEEWDVTEAAKVLKWYEEEELLRPCDCDTMVAIETEDLKAENAKLRELAYDAHSCIERFCAKYGCEGCPLLHNEMEPCDFASVLAEMRELGIEVES